MAEFYVSVQVHGDITIEAETVEEAENLAETYVKQKGLDNIYHVDVTSVDHPDDCDCPYCIEEE